MNQNGILQDHVYEPSDDEWVAGKLSSLNLPMHPDTKLAITRSGERLHLFFQAESGVIREIIYDSTDSSGAWKLSDDLSAAKPIAGTGICASTRDGIVSVGYVHEDGSIHQCTHQDGSWLGNFYTSKPYLSCQGFSHFSRHQSRGRRGWNLPRSYSFNWRRHRYYL